MTLRRIWPFVALVLGATLLTYMVLIKPAQDRQQAATAKAREVVATTQGKAAEETVRIVVEHQDAINTITRRTEVTTREILSQPGASASISPELHAAGVRALCLHDNRADDPVCAAMLHPDGGSHGAR